MKKLERRRAQLDEASASIAVAPHGQAALEALVAVLSDITNAGTPDDELDPVEPAEADAVVAQSAVVREALEGNPWLATAPDQPAFQRWTTSSGRLTNIVPARPPALQRMTPVTAPSPDALTRRPLPGGLFTSSAAPGPHRPDTSRLRPRRPPMEGSSRHR